MSTGEVNALTSRIYVELDQARTAGAFSAAAVAVSVAGHTEVLDAIGDLAVVNDHGDPIAAWEREPADIETLFDLASVTKVYSAHTFLRLVEKGILGLDEPIATWLPAYGDGAKRAVTLRHLLTHTSGLPATWNGWRSPLARVLAHRRADEPALTDTPLADRDALLADLESIPLGAEPGTRWEYACTGFNTAMLVAERATGRRWEELLLAETLEPLGLADTTVRPERHRAAASEWQPELARGTIRGIVHDESSWSLGGGAANAGLFASAADVLAFAEAIRLGQTGPMQAMMWEDQLPCVLPVPTNSGHPGFGASLGLRIGETSLIGDASKSVRGHTGFTGTSIAIDRDAEWSFVLLTNRVHPSRANDGVNVLRARIADIFRHHADGTR